VAVPGGFQITVGAVDYTSYVDVASIQIESNLAIMLDKCDFIVAIPNQAIYRPKAGQEVIVTSLLGREFGGIIVTPEEDQTGSPRQLDYKVTTRDYSFLLDRHVAFKEYAADTFDYDDIVKDLVTTYGQQDGFTVNNVQKSFQAPFTRFDYQPVAQSINLMAQQIAWGFYVDYNRDVHFFEKESFASPLPNNTLHADTDTVVADGTYGQLGVYGDLVITEDISQIRDRVFLRGHKVTATYNRTETFTGDGSTTSFGLTYEPSHNLKQNASLTVGGSNYNVAADLRDGTPASTAQDHTGYVNFTGQTLRFNVPPVNGAAISFTYKPMLPLVVMVEDPAKQKTLAARIGNGNDGVFEYAISDPTLSADDSQPAVARGQEQIVKYGSPHISGTFTSYLHGWKAGQSFLFRSTRRMNGELDGTTFFVTKVAKRVVTHPANKQPLFLSTISFSDSVYVH
jgi:hypothetical protein